MGQHSTLAGASGKNSSTASRRSLGVHPRWQPVGMALTNSTATDNAEQLTSFATAITRLAVVGHPLLLTTIDGKSAA